MYVHLNHLGQCDMPDVALRVDGTVVEGEPVATTGVRQEDVAVSGRGGLAVLLQGDTAPAFVVAFLRWEASAGCDGGRPLDLITYCQSQTVIRSPVAVDPLHRQILMKELLNLYHTSLRVVWLLKSSSSSPHNHIDATQKKNEYKARNLFSHLIRNEY